MQDVLIIKKTPNYFHYLKRLNSVVGRTSLVYELHTNDWTFVKKGKNEKGLRFVHPKGGPTLTQGEKIPDTELVVQDIVFKKNEQDAKNEHTRIFLILKESV